MKKLGHVKIAMKCLFKKNKANQLLIICVCILFFIPTFLYCSTESIIKQANKQQNAVFGVFTDIYYRNNSYNDFEVTNQDIDSILPGFHYDSFGTIYTVYREKLTDNKMLNVGYADNIALELSCIKFTKGTFPKSNSEITLSSGVALVYDKKFGDKITIANQEYTIVGIFEDYGHLWPRGEEEIKENISPVNAFITIDQAKKIYNSSQNMYQQILIKRTLGVSNETEELPNFYKNSNLKNDTDLFNVPNSFKIILYVISLAVVISILILNQKSLIKRFRTYYSLGMNIKDILLNAKIELYIIIILGLIIGLSIGLLFTYVLLNILASKIGVLSLFTINIKDSLLLYTVMIVGFIILVNLYINSLSKRITTYDSNHNRIYHHKENKVSLLAFDIFLNKKSLIAITILVALSTSLLTYGIFYGNYFKKDALALAPGYIPRDYDFQFVSTLQPAEQLKSENGVQKYAMFFTDTYEKSGASQEFVNMLTSEQGIEKVISYRENTKMNVLLKKEDIDDYISGYDNVFNLKQLLKIADWNKVYKHFDYNPDDILVKSAVIGYTQQSLKSLERSVVEGKINIDKILNGEEVVLRVPAYKIITRKFGNYDAKGVMRVDNIDSDEAINCNSLKVGDEITLSGLLTNEWINGAVQENQMDLFYRRDVKVKIGAIIRTNDGELPTIANNGTFVFSILTVNEAFEKLNIPANYSVVSLYTKPNTNNLIMSSLLSAYTSQVPHMSLEDWQTDVKTYKAFNVLVSIFSITLIFILTSVTLLLLINQLFMKTRMSLPTYSLYRINGLSYRKVITDWILQVFGCFALGCIITLPIIIIIFIFAFQIQFSNLALYIKPLYIIIAYASIFVIVCISILPSISLLYKRKDNVILDIN